MTWSTADIVAAAHAGLRRHAAALDAEQAVYGLDSLDELRLHPILQQTWRDAGLGVWPEQRYPGDQLRPKRSEGKRCDVVLTAAPHLVLRDPLAEGTLFAGVDAVDAAEAYWLEIKTVAQYDSTGPFARYSAELLAPVTQDVRKLAEDELIRQAGLLLVLFTRDPTVAEHDLEAWRQKCLEKGLAVGLPEVQGFALRDRLGNAWCATALFPVREEIRM